MREVNKIMKQTKILISTIVLLGILCATSIGALLYMEAEVSNTVTIQGVNLVISQNEIAWADFEEGTVSNQTVTLNLSNSKNTAVAITYVTDLNSSETGLTLTFPEDGAILDGGANFNANVTLAYDGSTSVYDEVSFVITVEGTEQ